MAAVAEREQFLAKRDAVTATGSARHLYLDSLRRKIYLKFDIFTFRGVAQLVARDVWDVDAAGSNPVAPTKKPRERLILSLGFLIDVSI